MYKVGIVSREILIYNSKIESCQEAYDDNLYIAYMTLSYKSDAWVGTVWDEDASLSKDSDPDWIDIVGDSKELVFFKVKVYLIELGFDDSIFHLELPKEVSGV